MKLSTRGCLRSFVTSHCCVIDFRSNVRPISERLFSQCRRSVNGFSCAAANRLFDHLLGSDKEGPGELGGVARPACEEASVRLSGSGNLVLS
jgi:hypothetical protein